MLFKEDEQLYFSTKVELKIDGVIYRPSICYKVPPLAKRSLQKFVATGQVTFYNEQVRFVNGGVAKSPLKSEVVGVASVVRDVETTKSHKKKGK
jgi:hypothetical protein